MEPMIRNHTQPMLSMRSRQSKSTLSKVSYHSKVNGDRRTNFLDRIGKPCQIGATKIASERW